MRASAETPMGMKTNHIVVLALSLFVLAGCSKRDAASAPSSAPVAGIAAAPKSDAISAGRALIVTQDVRVTVADVDAAATRIRAEVDRAGGYVADGSTSGKGEDRSAHF